MTACFQVQEMGQNDADENISLHFHFKTVYRRFFGQVLWGMDHFCVLFKPIFRGFSSNRRTPMHGWTSLPGSGMTGEKTNCQVNEYISGRSKVFRGCRCLFVRNPQRYGQRRPFALPSLSSIFKARGFCTLWTFTPPLIMSPRKKITVNKFYLIKSAKSHPKILTKITNVCFLNNLIWIVSALVNRHNFSPLKVQNQI